MKRAAAFICGLMMTSLVTACGMELNEGGAGEKVNANMQEAAGSVAEGRRILQNTQQAAAKMMVQDTEKSDLEERTIIQMNVQAGDAVFTANLEDNEAAKKFAEMMKKSPLVIPMSDYAGFEKSGDLGISLPVKNSHTTAQPGDIVLYNGNKIVIFYGSNSWSYTRIGKIINLDGWAEALGSGDVTVTFSLNLSS